MKKIFISLLFLTGTYQAFGMKKHALRFPISAAQNKFTRLFTRRNYGEALTLAETCKNIGKNLVNSQEINILSQQLEADLYTANDHVVKDMYSPLRNNCWWMLPTSTTLLTSVQDPKLLTLGVVGLALGSIGFQKQCNYWANKLKYNSLVNYAQKFNELFCTKEKELKTK